MERKGSLIRGKGAEDLLRNGNLNQKDKSHDFNAEINGKKSPEREK